MKKYSINHLDFHDWVWVWPGEAFILKTTHKDLHVDERGFRGWACLGQQYWWRVRLAFHLLVEKICQGGKLGHRVFSRIKKGLIALQPALFTDNSLAKTHFIEFGIR